MKYQIEIFGLFFTLKGLSLKLFQTQKNDFSNQTKIHPLYKKKLEKKI